MPTYLELTDETSEKVQYDFKEYPIYVHRAMLSTYPNYSGISHWHDAVEFIAVFSGSMNYNVNGEIIPMRSGEGVFVNARQLHFGSSEQTECDFLCVLLHPLLLCTSAAMEENFILPLIQNENLPYIKLQKGNHIHQQIIMDLHSIYDQKDTLAAPMKIQAMFSSIWATLFESVSQYQAPDQSGSSNLSIMKNMIGFIQQNYSEKISLAEIADSGAVGQSKCCKLFHLYLNQTPNEYLTAYRLNKSTKLLCNTDMTIAEIALEAGFNGASYYAETFRKWFGESPSDYRSQSHTVQHD